MLKRLGQIELAICVILLAVITGLVFVASVMRFFGYPLVWSVDLAQLLFIWVCFLGADKTMREKTHVGMEIPVNYLPYKYHLWLELACAVIILALLAILAVKGYELTLLNIERTFGDSMVQFLGSRPVKRRQGVERVAFYPGADHQCLATGESCSGGGPRAYQNCG